MNIEIVLLTVFALVVLIAFVLAEMPIWIALAASGTIGLLILSGSGVTYNTLGSVPYGATASYALVIIPMFVLMGVFASKAGLATDIFAVAEKVTSKLPGGLGIATILACGGFSAVTGSSVATVATIGKIAIDQMIKHGYRANAAAALVALGATLGVLIPPSILMVVFGTLTGESVGRLLLAGIIPGLLTMVAYMITVFVFYKRGFFQPKTEKEKALFIRFSTALDSAVVDSKTAGAESNSAVSTQTLTIKDSFTETGLEDFKVVEAEKPKKLQLRNFIGAGYTALLFTIVIGGMYSGIFTSTESGAIAAAAALIILIIRRSNLGFKNMFSHVKDSLIETASTSSMIFAMLFGGAIFAFFLLKTGIPSSIARSIVDAQLSPLLVIIVSLVMLIILGAFLDELSILVIVIPLIWPIIDQMGVDGIWYGILVMKATSIGLVAPPVGINVFVASGISKHVSADGIYKAIIPFFITELVVIAILIIFPEISTFLPNQIYQ